ncbi:uncharacterized protein BDZ99DRAFT_520382 [Mytilinidion resinicola]|uniref:Uncharacterized protein n=1 Tax=Mytilinidion resinicola TaxID=574789 RepID=A0A6A6YN42_9PEZI|nr:uncharacterized protein BDZ99DRAFT_520382 [Mytilinidion resinicola]KAF2810306.1 hypothetical protein BDZ99DRAFT_520382 [Mytilinidion resinicola]
MRSAARHVSALRADAARSFAAARRGGCLPPTSFLSFPRRRRPQRSPRGRAVCDGAEPLWASRYARRVLGGSGRRRIGRACTGTAAGARMAAGRVSGDRARGAERSSSGDGRSRAAGWGLACITSGLVWASARAVAAGKRWEISGDPGALVAPMQVAACHIPRAWSSIPTHHSRNRRARARGFCHRAAVPGGRFLVGPAATSSTSTLHKTPAVRRRRPPRAAAIRLPPAPFNLTPGARLQESDPFLSSSRPPGIHGTVRQWERPISESPNDFVTRPLRPLVHLSHRLGAGRAWFPVLAASFPAAALLAVVAFCSNFQAADAGPGAGRCTPLTPAVLQQAIHGALAPASSRKSRPLSCSTRPRSGCLV